MLGAAIPVALTMSAWVAPLALVFRNLTIFAKFCPRAVRLAFFLEATFFFTAFFFGRPRLAAFFTAAFFFAFLGRPRLAAFFTAAFFFVFLGRPRLAFFLVPCFLEVPTEDVSASPTVEIFSDNQSCTKLLIPATRALSALLNLLMNNDLLVIERLPRTLDIY